MRCWGFITLLQMSGIQLILEQAKNSDWKILLFFPSGVFSVMPSWSSSKLSLHKEDVRLLLRIGPSPHCWSECIDPHNWASIRCIAKEGESLKNRTAIQEGTVCGIKPGGFTKMVRYNLTVRNHQNGVSGQQTYPKWLYDFTPTVDVWRLVIPLLCQ